MAEVPFVEDDDGRVVYDLDAYKAARREGQADAYIRVSGVEVRMPTAGDLPLESMEMLQAGEISKLLKLMFKDDYDTVRDAGLSLDDVQTIVALIMGRNPLDALGELQASTPLISTNFADLEADFQREYGLDLTGAIWGPEAVGPRKLSALVKGLSPSARLYRTTEGYAWGYNEELLVQLIELTHLHLQVTAAANSKKRRRPKALHLPRPEMALTAKYKKPKRKATVEDAIKVAQKAGLAKG